MKALTICQPWAWAIAEGIKRVENRTWPTSYRGPLAIHAGKGAQWITRGWLDLRRLGHRPPDDLTFGAIVAVCDLVDCRRYGESDVFDDPFAVGPWCFILENVRKLAEPIPCRGRQRMWDCQTILDAR